MSSESDSDEDALFELCGLRFDGDEIGDDDDEQEPTVKPAVAALRPAHKEAPVVAPRSSSESEEIPAGMRGDKAFAGSGDGTQRKPDLKIVRDRHGGVCLLAKRRFEEGETVLVETALLATPLSKTRRCWRCLRSLATSLDVLGVENLEGWPAVPFTSCEKCNESLCRFCPSDTRKQCCALKAVSAILEAEPAAFRLCGRFFALLAAGPMDLVVTELCGGADDCDLLGLAANEHVHAKMAAALSELGCFVDAPSLAWLRSTAAKLALNSFKAKLRSPLSSYHEGLIRRHGRGSSRIGLGMCGKTFDREALASLDEDTAALFALTSCANHSCAPNCEVYCDFETPIVELKAKSAIEQGAEVSISYFDQNAVCGASNDEGAARRRRRAYLRRNYLFECECELCSSTAPSL